MKIFGQKLTGKNINAFGKKIYNASSVIGRKTINTIDKLSPLLQIASVASGQPEIAMGINSLQSGSHAIHDAITAGSQALRSKNQDDYNNALVNFGENLQAIKQNDLLRRD